jgi:hypothetical protein
MPRSAGAVGELNGKSAINVHKSWNVSCCDIIALGAT